jgi:protein-S-isoprenylcysteine O-methyltransferase Ste14
MALEASWSSVRLEREDARTCRCGHVGRAEPAQAEVLTVEIVGGVMILLGAVAVLLGVGAMTSDTYDTARWVHIVIGSFLVVPGLALAYGGFRLIRRS